ncbi:hypothetical protein [Sulfurospirillum arcachonense]|uniref:hypothetical protein n=1 Tax=Sulfurospirillum arcachonense TaxID=57666 RepID=UPI001FDF2170|nr:hypothetical protein [Sulfurospirillum arcachonense]
MIKSICSEQQTSEALPLIFKDILEEFTCKRIFFARGPGSFMAIKITYILLRTLSIVKGIELFATDGFNFNQNSPIKAMRKMYFVKEDELIKTEFIEDEIKCDFYLPQNLKIENFSKDIEPLYILPAV